MIFLFFGSFQIKAQTCNTKEYIYLNEPSKGTVMKFEVGSAVALTEVLGANGGPHWYPRSGVSELASPHGLATDLNGKLYIGESGLAGKLRRFNCDGVIESISPTTIATSKNYTQNIFSIGNIIYHNATGGPMAFNSCTGQSTGQLCYSGSSGQNEWGLSYNPVTELVYASDRYNGAIWIYPKSRLEGGIAANPGKCIEPFIIAPVGGQNFGIVSDNNGNFYLATKNGIIYKFNKAGQLITSVDISAYNSFLIGLTWSETYNRLYVSNFDADPAQDCISVIDPVTMTYLGAGVPNPAGGGGNGSGSKALAILKESCPINLPASYTRNVCGAVGTKFYLNDEAFSGCPGIVCGSSWAPQGVLNGMTYDACDNSVTITGVGCGVFNLNTSAVASNGCAAQSSTFSICNTLPPDIIVTTQVNCNSNGTYTLIGTVTVAGGAPPTGTLTVRVPGGGSQTFNAPFASTINFSISNITSFGDKRTVYAEFSETNCTKAQDYTEPPITCTPTYGSIGDFIWTDTNNDGQQTAGESPIVGVKVYLYDGTGTVKLDSTVTDAAGKYLFDSLLTGAYKVQFVAPAGTIAAKQNLGADVSDSDANKLGFSQVVNINTALLASDTLRNNPQIDAGFVSTCTILV